MAEWFNTSSAVPEWKTFITTFQQTKKRQGIKSQHLQFTIQPHLVPSLKNIHPFLSNVTSILNQLKSYNNEMTDFIRNNLPLLLKESIRMILEVPEEKESQERKNRFPLQSLEFVQGLMYLPNIFNLNILKEELYVFYCKTIMHYFKQNLDQTHSMRNVEEYQNALYKNYFFRLFELPYALVECETRMGANFASMTMSVASSSAQAPKKQSFLECLISTLQKNPQFMDLLISNISCESLLSCLSKIVMTNGMYNYPYLVKDQIIRKLFATKKKYIQMLSNIMNSKIGEKETIDVRQELQLQIQNILQLQLNIVNRSANIYDGIKLFQLIGNIDNVKDVVYLTSVNIVWTNRNLQNKPLVPGFIEEHLTELLLSIVHKDTILYKSSSPTIQLQPKISLRDTNVAVQPLLLSLKQLVSQKATKAQIKHMNLIKILFVMILNRQKYQILDGLLIKHNLLCLLVEVCKKFYHMDILVNSIMQIFKSIFKSQMNLLILPSNAPNLQEVKSKNDLMEQKITAQAFKAVDILFSVIKGMKSHKDPLFGHCFKLAKVIKQFSRNLFSTIQSSTCLDVSSSSSIQIQSSVNLGLVLEPLYRNDFIKTKCRQWQDFYMANFMQLENNYLRELGKFEEFDKAPQQPETQYTVVRLGEQKQLTNSQVIHDKAEFEATIKNSIQILSLKKKQQSQSIESNPVSLNFKKDKGNNKKDQLSNDNSTSKVSLKPLTAQLLTKEEIQITNQPIKIQFKKKKTENLDQTDSANQQVSVEEGEQTFKNFMKKKLDQITTQNRQNRKKSKTPTKFKSSDSKTPPKMKKWGSTQPQQSTKTNQNDPLSQKKLQIQRSSSETSQQTRNFSLDDNLQKLKKKISDKKPLPIKIILVGKKVPKVYKQRDVDVNGRDSRLMAWIRG